jgi:hypothetical protein
MIAARVAARYNATQIEARAMKVQGQLVKSRTRLWRELLQFYQHQPYGNDPNPTKAERVKQRLLETYVSLRNDIASVVEAARALADRLKSDKVIPSDDEERFDNYSTFRSHVENTEHQLQRLDDRLRDTDNPRAASQALVGSRDYHDMTMIDWMQVIARDLRQLNLDLRQLNLG